jgi:hypothetical protein
MAIEKYKSGEKIIWKGRPTKAYDFGYYSQVKGTVVIYEEGCRNMQDSLAVKIKDIERAHCQEPDSKLSDALFAEYNKAYSKTKPGQILPRWFDPDQLKWIEKVFETFKNGRKKT